MNESLKSLLTLPTEKSVEKPIWIEGSEIEKCSVSLQFLGEDLIPDEVTRLLGIKPTRSYKKGDVFPSKAHEQIRKVGLWLYSVNRCAGVSLENQINALFDLLPVDLDVWRELTTRFEADLFCGLQLEALNHGLDFSQQTLQRINERGLSIGLDLYFDDEKDL